LRRGVYDDFVAAKGPHPPQCLHDDFVRYYYDNTGHWHRRFLMERHGMEMSPVLVQANAGAAPLAGVMSLGQYHWWLLDGRAQRAAGRQGIYSTSN
jgi:hypothetical protein